MWSGFYFSLATRYIAVGVSSATLVFLGLFTLRHGTFPAVRQHPNRSPFSILPVYRVP